MSTIIFNGLEVNLPQDAGYGGGAAVGGYAGNKVQEGVQERNTYQEVQQKCETVYDSHEEPDGFDVSYRLQNVEKTIHMDYDPGDRIPVENGELVLE